MGAPAMAAASRTSWASIALTASEIVITSRSGRSSSRAASDLDTHREPPPDDALQPLLHDGLRVVCQATPSSDSESRWEHSGVISMNLASIERQTKHQKWRVNLHRED